MRYALGGLCLTLVTLTLHADAHWKECAARWPQAMAVVDSFQESFEVEADGKYLATTCFRATALQEQGLSAVSQYSDSYCTKYDQVKVLRAEVIGPDGKVTAVGQEHIKDLPMPGGNAMYLPDLRMVLITFPQLQVGATVAVTIQARREAPPMDHAFSLTETLQAGLPILNRELKVTLPGSMPLAWKAHRGTVAFTREERGGRTEYLWRVGEQAQMLEEPGMPPVQDVAPVLALSTIPTWKEVSRWYADLAADGQVLTPALRARVAEVTASASTREEKIRALFFWVSRQIRYVETASFNGDKAGFKPAAAEVTYARRYGVCRDKGQLLVTLLRGIGVDAHPVLLNAGVKQDIDIPCTQFNHLMVGIREADGLFRFLDPTAEDTRQYLPNSGQQVQALVCTREGEDLRLTPLDPPSANGMDLALETELGGDGALASKVVMTARGGCDTLCRQFLQGQPPANRERFFRGMVAAWFPGGQMESLSLSDPADRDLPVEIRFTLKAPGQGIQAGPYLLFTTPGQGGYLDLILPWMLSGASAPSRTYPVKLFSTLEARVREVIKLPAGYRVRSLPEAVKADQGSLQLSRVCQASSEGLVYEEGFSAGELYFAGSAYDQLRQTLEKRSRLREGKVVLVKGGVL